MKTANIRLTESFLLSQWDFVWRIPQNKIQRDILSCHLFTNLQNTACDMRENIVVCHQFSLSIQSEPIATWNEWHRTKAENGKLHLSAFCISIVISIVSETATNNTQIVFSPYFCWFMSLTFWNEISLLRRAFHHSTTPWCKSNAKNCDSVCILAILWF